VPNPLDAVDYAWIIKRLSIARQIIHAGEEIAHIGFSNPPDVVAALSDCDQKLTEVRKSGVKFPIISPKERADMLFDHYNQLHNSEAVAAGTNWHI